MGFIPFCNTEIVFASSDRMQEILLALDKKRIVVILSESAAKRWKLLDFMAKLQTKADLVWIKQCRANPTQSDLLAALEQIGQKRVELIIGFGGGSVIDLAKGISAFYDAERSYTLGEITRLIKEKIYPNQSRYIDIVAVPSTAGTGSELTQWATIWDVDRNVKYSIDAPRLMPKLALIVPELTLTLPAKLTIVTALDSLSHAVEAYWSRHTSPLVQEIAFQAANLIFENLGQGVREPGDIQAREMLCRASVLAGLAFSQTRTTACHSISYPMTMIFEMPHGLAAAITLEAVANRNKGHFPNDIRLLALFERYGGLLHWMDTVCGEEIKLRLSAFGITQDDIEIIVDKAFAGGRMENNPVDFKKEDVRKILEDILN